MYPPPSNPPPNPPPDPPPGPPHDPPHGPPDAEPPYYEHMLTFLAGSKTHDENRPWDQEVLFAPEKDGWKLIAVDSGELYWRRQVPEESDDQNPEEED